MGDQIKNHKSKNWFEKIADIIFFSSYSASDFLDMVNLAVEKGTIDNKAQDMIKGVLNIASSSVSNIMIPRTQMVTLHTGMNRREIISTILNSNHTRLPVFSENREDILGILHTKDLLKMVLQHKDSIIENLQPILRNAIFVPESKKLDILLRDFKTSHSHLAIVVNEYGVISGLVTIENILEEIVGDIEDEFDQEETQILKISECEYSIDALTEIKIFNEFFNVSINDSEVDTIGGFIINKLGHLPEIGEKISIEEITFKVTAANKRRVKTLQINVHKK